MSGGLPVLRNCICQLRKYLRHQGLSEEEVGDVKIPWKIMRIVLMVDWANTHTHTPAHKIARDPRPTMPQDPSMHLLVTGHLVILALWCYGHWFL